MFSSIDRVAAEIREIFQQCQNLAQRYAFLRPKVILSVDELNLDQAPKDINKEEFKLERYVYKLSLLQQTHAVKKNLLGPALLVY
ncbi:uncharacterized protein TNCV_2961591 [Trichonephila clavipes]|nr:uncharacterized protein TNCV_2961591 [Trichonephila clavipes]